MTAESTPQDPTHFLPAELPPVDGNYRYYRWRNQHFAIRQFEPNEWTLRDDDSTTLGTLSQLDDETWRFVGNTHLGVPTIESRHWQTVLAYASVPVFE
ncbi:hypothetical protein DEJ30_08460 [Curtobacterium sp. MCPF17_003]|uniref:hypothetical protein n=1 Tax=Curtobacterium sp. MCPF17_003 TaxID=2175637 RepID=UPI000DA06401|nr:hypothetical protein [Curtobacterium sp. MCPF17_003]PYY64480.1 hypothetical protein DEJ30_08460 [Curtobacterium sp. MCPF17_003]